MGAHVEKLLAEWEREGRFPHDPNVLQRLREAIEADRARERRIEVRTEDFDGPLAIVDTVISLDGRAIEPGTYRVVSEAD